MNNTFTNRCNELISLALAYGAKSVTKINSTIHSEASVHSRLYAFCENSLSARYGDTSKSLVTVINLPRSLVFSSLIILFLFFSNSVNAQNWSGIISPSRAANWSNAGVVGGIPSIGWAQCGSTIAAYSGTSANINTRLAGCAPNTYVLLGPGRSIFRLE